MRPTARKMMRLYVRALTSPSRQGRRADRRCTFPGRHMAGRKTRSQRWRIGQFSMLSPYTQYRGTRGVNLIRLRFVRRNLFGPQVASPVVPGQARQPRCRARCRPRMGQQLGACRTKPTVGQFADKGREDRSVFLRASTLRSDIRGKVLSPANFARGRSDALARLRTCQSRRTRIQDQVNGTA